MSVQMMVPLLYMMLAPMGTKTWCVFCSMSRQRWILNETIALPPSQGAPAKGILEVTKGLLTLSSDLLGLGVDLQAKMDDGSTSLHDAAFRGQAEFVKLLISGGSNLETKKDEESTALHCAPSRGCTAVVKLLINAGAHLKAKRNDGPTALHDSARGGHVSITSELLKAGTQVNARRNDGTTALHRCDSIETVQLLLQNGAETEIRSRLISSILQSSHSTGVTSCGANLENNTICDQNMQFDVDIPD